MNRTDKGENVDDWDMTDDMDPEDTELWEAIQEARDDKFVQPSYPFEFDEGGDNERN
jgi:hypothetical protein